MTFFQSDIDPLHLREQYKQNSRTISQQEQLQENKQGFGYSGLFQQLFLGTPVVVATPITEEHQKTTKSITAEQLNRLISFHL